MELCFEVEQHCDDSSLSHAEYGAAHALSKVLPAGEVNTEVKSANEQVVISFSCLGAWFRPGVVSRCFIQNSG